MDNRTKVGLYGLMLGVIIGVFFVNEHPSISLFGYLNNELIKISVATLFAAGAGTAGATWIVEKYKNRAEIKEELSKYNNGIIAVKLAIGRLAQLKLEIIKPTVDHHIAMATHIQLGRLSSVKNIDIKNLPFPKGCSEAINNYIIEAGISGKSLDFGMELLFKIDQIEEMMKVINSNINDRKNRMIAIQESDLNNDEKAERAATVLCKFHAQPHPDTSWVDETYSDTLYGVDDYLEHILIDGFSLLEILQDSGIKLRRSHSYLEGYTVNGLKFPSEIKPLIPEGKYKSEWDHFFAD